MRGAARIACAAAALLPLAAGIFLRGAEAVLQAGTFGASLAGLAILAVSLDRARALRALSVGGLALAITTPIASLGLSAGPPAMTLFVLVLSGATGGLLLLGRTDGILAGGIDGALAGLFHVGAMHAAMAIFHGLDSSIFRNAPMLAAGAVALWAIAGGLRVVLAARFTSSY